MSKVMETTGMRELLLRIAGEYRAKGTIYEIPEASFRESLELEARSPGFDFLGSRVSLPLGPAAGPHSQIAPNIVAAWLSGSRVFELKTVQIMDRLEIEKPCILALDEGHNTEWSTELSLEEARDEYLRAWIALRFLGALWSEKPGELAFNISVGYTLEGIKQPRVDAFIQGMRAPAGLGSWKKALAELEDFVGGPDFVAAFGRPARDKVAGLLSAFPSSPVHSVTLSTMHGCPPAEIESIGRYLLEEKGLDTFVKLNPTLLGHEEARRILDATGWESVKVKPETFEHDLQFADALGLVRRLEGLAKERGRRFGIKMSNTLANENDGKRLPGAERYMSGRALFPLTSRLAARLAEALPGFSGPFSYCGGVSGLNARDLVMAGLGPLTVATDLLKPGGYQRLGDMAKGIVGALADPARAARPDPARIAALAEAALSRPEYRGDYKRGEARIPRRLPLFDCFAAPCVEACPVNQKVPEYIALAGEERNEEALAVILADNPLPCITGTLCDHVCQSACSRNDYEGTVRIREVKLHAATRAELGSSRPGAAAPQAGPSLPPGSRVAVVGAGPAGLAAAHHLAGAGLSVTVFDRDREAGGVVSNVVPSFRIPASARRSDIERIEALGVEFRLGTEIDSLEDLKKQGYANYIFCAGAPAARGLKLEGSGVKVVDALEFLAATARGDGPYAGLKRILVAGGGNTAMDALRRASRIQGVESVKLSYRRAKTDMPAEEEEIELALDEAAALAAPGPTGDRPASGPWRDSVLLDWSLPKRLEPGRLHLEKMRPGKPDASGRPSPEATGETFSEPCELLVAAIGETPDAEFLGRFGVKVGADGKPPVDARGKVPGVEGLYVAGDARRGPASIIQAEADGRASAQAILEELGVEHRTTRYAPSLDREEIRARRGDLAEPLLPAAEGFARREATRCLGCDSWCGRCVEVCPNRAYIAVPSAPGKGSDQILQIDALCNECGNCGSFCPWEGEPWKDKPALFADEAALAASPKAGFALLADRSLVYRAGSGAAPSRLAFDAWYAFALDGEDQGGRMIELARRVLRDSPWLVPALAGAAVGDAAHGETARGDAAKGARR